ncbi:MAG: RluA family pseudouridine synthase [Candidatus Marinimicrobia bacterium]|nr:RluA family pseudouridine synthase [Candidatus Neomarinimicrobiota bacterium]
MLNSLIEKHTFIVNQNPIRLDQFLTQKLPEFSRSKIQHYIKLGQVTINGEVSKPSCMLQGNERVECKFEPVKREIDIIPEKMDLSILYEDDHLIVLNKPSGLVVHPGSGNYSGTLLNGLKYHFKLLSRGDSQRPGIVHRLDKETSGVILIAKTDKAHDHLSSQFSERTVRKEYIALAWGNIDIEGIIRGEISRHPGNRQIFKVVDSGGRDALTHYALLENLAPLSLVKLFPKTGRTHQLRVHLKSIGHPIFGDSAYGGGMKLAKSFHVKYTQILNRMGKIINRVALHAQLLEVIHPETKEKIQFEAPLPGDMQKGLDILRNEP